MVKRTASGNILAGTSRGAIIPARLGLGLGLMGSRSFGGPPKRLLTPSDIAGIVSWYDPNDLGGLIQAGGFASQLTDLHGGGKHLVQATGANQPGVTTVNGKTRLSLSGSGQYMSTAVFTALSGGAGYVLAVLASFLSGSVSSGRILVGSNTSGADVASGAMRIHRNGTNAQTQIFGGSGSSTPILFTGVGYGNEHLYVAERNNSAIVRATLDGDAPVAGVPEAASLGWTRYAIGTNLTSGGTVGTSYLQGNIGPIACYNTLLSDADRQKLEGCLAWLAGVQDALVVGHPYRDAPPRVD